MCTPVLDINSQLFLFLLLFLSISIHISSGPAGLTDASRSDEQGGNSLLGTVEGGVNAVRENPVGQARACVPQGWASSKGDRSFIITHVFGLILANPILPAAWALARSVWGGVPPLPPGL